MRVALARGIRKARVPTQDHGTTGRSLPCVKPGGPGRPAPVLSRDDAFLAVADFPGEAWSPTRRGGTLPPPGTWRASERTAGLARNHRRRGKPRYALKLSRSP